MTDAEFYAVRRELRSMGWDDKAYEGVFEDADKRREFRRAFNEAVGCCCLKTPSLVLHPLFSDSRGTTESWTKIWAFAYEGEVDLEAENDDNADYQYIINQCDKTETKVDMCGSGEAGQAYAQDPVMYVYERHIIVEQRGGLDI